jgi:hypothetical protein
LSFLEIAERIINEGTLSVAFLIDEAGTVHWSHGEWPDLVPIDVVKAWQSEATAISIGDFRFSVIDRAEDKFVGRSIKGGGTLVVAKCLNWDGYLITWAQHEVQTTLAYSETARLANAVKS